MAIFSYLNRKNKLDKYRKVLIKQTKLPGLVVHPLVLVLRRQRQVDLREFTDSLVYTAVSGQPGLQRKTPLQKQQKQNPKTKTPKLKWQTSHVCVCTCVCVNTYVR